MTGGLALLPAGSIRTQWMRGRSSETPSGFLAHPHARAALGGADTAACSPGWALSPQLEGLAVPNAQSERDIRGFVGTGVGRVCSGDALSLPLLPKCYRLCALS